MKRERVRSPKRQDASLSTREKLDYSVFRFADVLAMTNMAQFVQVYWTIVWRIPPAWLAVVQPTLKLIDVVTDPLVGHLSDGTRSRLGRRRPWILWGGVALAAVFWIYWSPSWALFWIEEPPLPLLFAFYVVFYLGYYLTHTACAVPYNALGAELSSDQDERTRIFALRHVVGLPASILGASTYWLATRPLFPSEKEGMPVAMGIVSLVILGSAVYTVARTRERAELRRRPSLALPQAFRLTMRNRPFLLMCLASFFFFGAYLFTLQFGNYLVIYGIFGGDRARFAGLTIIGVSVAAVVALGTNLALRRYALLFDKKRAFAYFAALGFLVPVATLVAFDPEHPYRYLWLQVALAVALTNMDILPMAIIADVSDIDELSSGARREGAFAGVYNGIYKAGLLFSPLATNVFLELSGFDAHLEMQTAATVHNFRAILFGFTAVMVAASFVCALLYPLRREDVDRARTELARRRQDEGDRGG